MFDRNEENYEGEAYQEGFSAGQEKILERILKLLDDEMKIYLDNCSYSVVKYLIELKKKIKGEK